MILLPRIGSIKEQVLRVILVGACIVFKLYTFMIVRISCVELRFKKLTFMSPRTMILEDISLAFSMDRVNFSKNVPLEFGGRYTHHISKLLINCGPSIHKIFCIAWL